MHDLDADDADDAAPPASSSDRPRWRGRAGIAVTAVLSVAVTTAVLEQRSRARVAAAVAAERAVGSVGVGTVGLDLAGDGAPEVDVVTHGPADGAVDVVLLVPVTNRSRVPLDVTVTAVRADAFAPRATADPVALPPSATRTALVALRTGCSPDGDGFGVGFGLTGTSVELRVTGAGTSRELRLPVSAGDQTLSGQLAAACARADTSAGTGTAAPTTP